MMYTTNTGITWNSTTIPDRFGFLHFFDSSQGIAFGPLRRYFTSDGGVSWNVGGDTTDRIASGSDYAVQGNQNIWMVSPVSIIGTDIGFIAKSTDGGKNWVYQDSMSYMLFGVDFIDSLTGFAVGGGHFNNNGYLYSTIDGGLHWKITTFNATGDLIDVAFLDSIHGWIISENTIYRTTNGGISWEVQNTIPGINFEKVFISKNDHFGYIIGSYPGRKKHILLVADLNIPLHRDIDHVKEPVLDVLNNYPNPFNSSTTINYSIKTAGRVQIQVTSILGEVIATLINESKSPGEYQTVWNGKSDQGQYVGSGVYFIKFSNFNTIRSIKIQYLK
ncbi:MAG: T9SS type A sorting domain-containing protein [Bacteroidetes bacterium]|nr:T9SS type A sorting domain-containing protein [Bacteroidota bacterium]